MSDWFIRQTSSKNDVIEGIFQSDRGKITISVSKNSLTPADSSEINQKAAKVICTADGLSPEDTVALLRVAKEGIEQLLRSLT